VLADQNPQAIFSLFSSTNTQWTKRNFFLSEKGPPNLFRRSDNSIWQEIHEFSQFFTVSHSEKKGEKKMGRRKEKIFKHAQNRLGWIAK
jgi:hypothetical protein